MPDEDFPVDLNDPRFLKMLEEIASDPSSLAKYTETLKAVIEEEKASQLSEEDRKGEPIWQVNEVGDPVPDVLAPRGSDPYRKTPRYWSGQLGWDAPQPMEYAPERQWPRKKEEVYFTMEPETIEPETEPEPEWWELEPEPELAAEKKEEEDIQIQPAPLDEPIIQTPVCLYSPTSPGLKTESPPPVDGSKPKRKNRFGYMLRAMIGIHEPLIEDLPGDRAWFTRASWVLVLVAGIASVSMANALIFALGSGALPFAVAFGVMWGIFILGIDILILFPKLETGRNMVIKSCLRVIVAILLGVVISAPLMAAIFKKDVETAAQVQITNERSVAYTAARARAVKGFAAESSTSGTDSQARFDTLTKEQTTAQAEANAALASCTAAQNGRSSLRTQICNDAQAKTDRANNLQAQLDAERAALTAAQTGGTADQAAKLAAWDKANAVVPFDAEKDLGVWVRIKATHHLLGWAAWLIVVFLVIIDSMAVIMKILRGNGQYERRMDLLENPPKRGRKRKTKK